MPIAAKLDEWGLPAWIALMILSFWVFWPLGLVVLAFLIGSGRMGCGHHRMERWQNKMERMQAKVDRMRGYMEQGGSGRGGWWGSPPSSGNRAFDDYRTETLRRLEDEQREFREFLERLRFAKDRTEFEQFMAERRDRAAGRPRRSDAATAELNDDLSKCDLSKFDGPSAFNRRAARFRLGGRGGGPCRRHR